MGCLQTALLAMAVLGAGERETVLLDFHADWCGPCRQLAPTVDRLVAAGYPVRKINVDHQPRLAKKYHVLQIPCFVMLVDGRVVDRVNTSTTYRRLERMCQMGVSRSGATTANTLAAAPVVAIPSTTSNSAFSTFPAFPAQSPQKRPKHAPSDSTNLIPRQNLGGWKPAPSDALEPREIEQARLDNLIAATVRLQIEDSKIHSRGSGTIIDARLGEALILTCGHIFRDSKGKGAIEVVLFGPDGSRSVKGRLLAHDLKRDLGLVVIRTPGPVATAKVAPPGFPTAVDDRVINVGCNNGEPPSLRRGRVTAIDKYLGPPNIEVAGVLPVKGRSGGGLFSADGHLIGVCNAADPADQEGIYAALRAVHTQLDEAQLTQLYQKVDGPFVPERSLADSQPPAMPKDMPRPTDRTLAANIRPFGDAQAPGGRLAEPHRLTDRERATLEAIRRHKAEGAEVICLVQSNSAPESPSKVLVLNQASTGFLRQLAMEANGGPADSRHYTSLDVPAEQASCQGPIDPGSSDRPLVPAADRLVPAADRLVPVANRPPQRRVILEYQKNPQEERPPIVGTPWQPAWRTTTTLR